MFGGLPQVGAQAVISNMAGFNQAANQVNRQLNIINRAAINLDRSSRSAFTAFGVGIAAGAAAAAAAVVGFSLKTSAELQRLGAVTKTFGEATDNEMKRTAQSVRDLSREYSILPTDVATATKELVKAGASMDTINKSALAAVTVLARTSDGEISVAEAADRVTQSMTAYKLSQDEAFRVTNAVVGAVQNSTATFGDLNVQLKQATPISSSLGHTIEETSASLAALNQAGLRGEVAGTAYKNMLIALIDPTTKAGKVLDQYNISLFNSAGRAKGAREIIVELNDAFGEQALASGKLTQAEQQRALSTIFSTRQIQAALTFLNQGVQAYDSALADIKATSSEEIARNLQKNLIDQAALARNNLLALATAVTDQLIPAMTNLGMATVTALQGISDKPFEAFGQAISRVISLQNELAAGATGKVLAAFLNLGDAISSLGNAIFGAISKSIDFLDIFNGIADAAIDVSAGIKVFAERISLLIEAEDRGAQGIAGFADASIEGADLWGRAFAIIANVTETVLVGIANLIAKVGIPALQFLGKAGLALLSVWSQLWTGIAETVGNNLRDIARDIAAFVDTLSAFVPDIIGFFGVHLGNEIPGLAGLGRMGKELAEFGSTTRTRTAADIAVATAGLDAMTEAGVRLQGQAQATSDSWRDSLKNFLGDVRATAAESKEAANRMVANFAKILAGAKSVEDAHDRLRRAQQSNARRNRGSGDEEDSGDFDFGDDGGGKIPKAEQLAAMRALVDGLLSDMPGITKELTEFIAGIAVDAPARLAPMVQSIRDSREQIIGLIGAKQSVLAIDMQLAAVQERITDLTLQANLVSIEQAQAMIGFDKQLLGLKQQALEIDRQTWPIKDALEKVERQMSKLQRENLTLARQRIQIEQDMLPLQAELAAIELKIADTQKVNYDLTRRIFELEFAAIPHKRIIEDIDRAMEARKISTLQLDRQALTLQTQLLPLKRQEAQYEDAITRLVDKRAALLSRREEIGAETNVENLRSQLDATEKSLEDAWSKFTDVETILALEEQKKVIKSSLEAAEKALSDIQKTQAATAKQTELASIGLQLEKLGIEELIDPLQRRLDIINQTKEDVGIFNQIVNQGLEDQRLQEEALLRVIETRDIALKREQEDYNKRNEAVRLGLEQEKARIEALLAPMKAKLDAITREIQEENLRNQLTMTHLEEERRKLQDQLEPLEDQRKAIERIIQEIEFQRAAANLAFEERKLQIQEQLLQEQRMQAQLEITRRAQHAIYEQLILDFIAAQAESGAFTADEAMEVSKRLRFWDDQVAKLAESSAEMKRLQAEAAKVAQAIRDIPDRTVTVTTVYKTVHEGGAEAGSGTAPTGSEGAPQMASGGRVPGRAGQPSLIMAHGGEWVVPVRALTPSNVQAGESIGGTNISNSVINNYTYSMSPRYSQYQSPARLKDDMNALLMATQK